MDCGWLVKKSLIQLHVGGGRQRFSSLFIRMSGMMVLNKRHPDVAVPGFEVVQGSMESDGYGIICGSVRPECKLMVVQGWREAGFDVF